MPLVHPTAVVSDGAQLADDVHVGPYAVVGPKVRMGRGCRIEAHGVVTGSTRMGEHNRIHSHAVIGSDPQDRKYRGEETHLVVGDRNVFREGVTVNTGTVQGGGTTQIGSRCAFLANSHVAHDCIVGDHVLLANNVMLAGHVRLHDRATINGGAGIHHFTTVGRCVYVGGLTRITRDVPPFMIVEGHPSRVRGVNVIGLKRAGYSEETILILKEAFRTLYRSDLVLKDAMERLEKQFSGCPELLELVSFLRASELGRQGRQFESPDRSLR